MSSMPRPKTERIHSQTIDMLMKPATMLRKHRRTTASTNDRTRDRKARARSKHIDSILSLDGRKLSGELNVVITGLKGSGKVDLFSHICHKYPERKLEDSVQEEVAKLEPEMRRELTRHFLTEAREILERARGLSLESPVDLETVVQTLSSNLRDPLYISQDSFDVLKKAGIDELLTKVEEQEEHPFTSSHAFKSILPEFLKAYPKWGGQNWNLSKNDRVVLALFRAKSSVGTFSIDSEGTSINFSLDNQSSEAKRWFQVFDQVDAFIFVAAVDEYDLPGKRGCRLQDSIHEFFKRVNNENLLKIPMFLILSRTTSFDTKFRKEQIPLNVRRKFPGAPTDNLTISDSDRAIEFIKDKYLEKVSNVRSAEEGGPVVALKMSDAIKDSELATMIHQLRLFQATQGVMNLNV